MSARRTLLLFAFLVSPRSGAAQGAPPATDVFARATEPELDSLYGPLVYLMRPEERGVYPGLSLAGKRDFLERFWAARDPTPGTPENQAEDTFNGRIAVVNRRFAERGTSDIQGWRTDRGRIFLESGPPDIILGRRGPGVAVPYEVWKYLRGTIRKYGFVDLTGFGNYTLVYSTDPAEPSRPEWQVLVGEQTADEVVRF
jgi:GWxTD domain-containing protein